MKSKVFVIIIVLLTVTACASTQKATTSSEKIPNEMTSPPAKVVLGPGDVIDVKFRFLPELDYQQTIRPDGKISLQMVDEVVAAGLTPKELDKHLTELYSGKLKSPEITVVVVSLANQFVYVGGEVQKPGVLPLAGQLSAIQAVMNSGGFKESAEPRSAIIIRKSSSNKPIPMFTDLQKVLDGSSTNTDILLQPADIVYVPKSPIAKVNLFVKQYIHDLIPFRGFGLSYDLNDD